MKKLILLPLVLLSSCAWVLSHPEVDEAVVETVEQAGVEIYKEVVPPFKPGVSNAIKKG